ncbi:hypothetical protein [Azotosporobacter soli]|uniref:hypothetical protein n=1 Tax=Azotosporobacter soli TaxID=3055040 RepID=UPI0031FE4F0F
MNKLKVIYDVVKNLRAKERAAGIVKLEIKKDQNTIFTLQNEFEKNLLTKQSKSIIHTTLDYEGKQVQHQSTTEFSNCCHSRGHAFGHHHRHMGRCCGFKAKLSKLALAFHLLQELQAEEQADHTIRLTLNLTKLPEELKELLEMAKEQHGEGDDCCVRKELAALTEGKFSLTVLVSEKSDIQTATLAFDGVQRSEEKGNHTLQFSGDLQFKK